MSCGYLGSRRELPILSASQRLGRSRHSPTRSHDENSELLYDILWSPFETEYWSTEQRRGRMKKPRLEWLIHSSLQAELHEEVDLARLYFEYRRFASAGTPPLSAEKQLLTLTDYAKHYRELVSGTGTSPISRFGRRIAVFDITTLHPLALMISASPIADDAKSEMFNDLVAYLMRRSVCGLTPKNYNNVFMSALKQLHGAGVTPNALRGALSGLTGDGSRWPVKHPATTHRVSLAQLRRGSSPSSTLM